MAKRIHDNDIIVMFIKKNVIKKSGKLINDFVHYVFCLFFGNELQSKYMCQEVERESL